MSLFNAGRNVGKGVRYLTQLGSKIGKGLKSGASSVGRGVDRVGAATRNTQAATIKGARGVRDAAANAGAAVKSGVNDVRRGYNTGRAGNLHLGDVMPKPSSGGIKRKTLQEFINTDLKGYIRNPGTMPGSKTTKDGKAVWANSVRTSTGSPGHNGKNWAIPVNKPKSIMPTAEDKAALKRRMEEGTNYMTKRKPSSGGGIINKPPRPPRSTGGVSPSDYNDWAGRNKSIVKQANKMRGNRDIYGNSTGGMSKNRRAGIITGASIAAGYGVHKGNDAIQNHYRQQKNAARGQ